MLEFKASGAATGFRADFGRKTITGEAVNWLVYGKFDGDKRIVLPRFTKKMRERMFFEPNDLTCKALSFIENRKLPTYSEWYNHVISQDGDYSRASLSKTFNFGN